MAKGKWSNKGVSQTSMKERDDSKGQNWRPDNFVSYIKNEIKRYFPRDGENCVRIVEPIEVDDLDYYGFHVHFHRNVGVENGSFLCLKRMLRQLCPICELQTDELWKKDPDLAKSYYPSEGMLMWVLNPYAETDKGKKELLLWQCPISLAEEILTQSNKKGTSVYVNVSDPVNGCLVYFDREKTGQLAYQVEYSGVQVAHDQLAPLADEVADQRIELFECLIVPTYDEVYAEFHGSFGTTLRAESEEDSSVDESHESVPAAEEPDHTEPEEAGEFVPEWLDTVCSVCGKDQFTSLDGDTCENGHGGAEGITKEEWDERNKPKESPLPKRPVRPASPKAVEEKEKVLTKAVSPSDIKAKLKAAIAKHKKGA